MKITVITVCRNSADTIEKAIQSVLSQKYYDLEYIIIDGGSTDGTLDIIEKYRNDISVCISEPDNGIYDAMNKGLGKAHGDIVAFLNSDDWYINDVDVLKKVEQYFLDSNADIVSGNVYLYQDGKLDKLDRSKPEGENIFFGIVCPHPAMFVKREVYTRLGGFDTSYKIAADTKWTILACMNDVSILCVEDSFTCFRAGGISTTKRYDTLKEQYEVVLDCIQGRYTEELKEQIDSYYIGKLKEMEKEKCLGTALGERIEQVRGLFDCGSGYYIWGAGVRGKECLKLFQRIGISVNGFIDMYSATETIAGYKVFRPEEADEKSCICITPRGHEEEIKAYLNYSGIKKSRYFTYSEMLDRIRAVGKDESGPNSSYGGIRHGSADCLFYG